jgi:hypothetical protein
MLRRWTRRNVLVVIETLAAAGMLPEMATARLTQFNNNVQPGTNPNVQPDNNGNTVAQQIMADILKSGTAAINAATNANIEFMFNQPISVYSGPQISANYGPAQPYIPGEEGEFELEGATREDFPPDYTNFHPETGLFDDLLD